MKILFVIESLGNGGAERVLLNTIPVLIRNGIHCEVATLLNHHDLVPEFEKQNIIVHQLQIGYRWNILNAIKSLESLIKNNNYDLVHAHLFFAHFYVALLKKLIFPKLKTIVTFHNMGYEADVATSMYKKLRKKTDKKMLETYNVKLAVSTAVKAHFVKEFNFQDIVIFHNGFDLNTYQVNKEFKPILFSSTTINILTPGRLVKEKGHEYLLEAIEKLNHNHNNLQFLFAGEGPSRTSIEDSIEEKKLQNVTLFGNVVQSELFNLIKHADFIVLPSTSEGFPMIVGEAMVLGKAIIATDVGGTPDFIDDDINGILVPSKNSEALAEKIELLIKDKNLRQKLGVAAIQKVQIFDIETIVKNKIEIYKKLIDTCAV